ncbi:DNA/RNA helicase domain-containing protein [Trueperella pyogenes]|uniref:DNA/RNA helicase domain-containing protein n=1 Tax=Trueperella pyogenes TaxID=1661 RepID=UPI00312B8B2F
MNFEWGYMDSSDVSVSSSLIDTYVARWRFGLASEENIESSVSQLERWTEEYFRKYALGYPTIYVVEYPDEDKYRRRFHVYVGETNNIQRRLAEHSDPKRQYRDDWRVKAREKGASVYVIANTVFNKSLTLDIENELILMLSGSPSVAKIHNWRGNPQGDYYTHENLDEIFSSVWEELRAKNSDLFLDIETIKDSALFKASPFHKLSESQAEAKEQIFSAIIAAISNGQGQTENPELSDSSESPMGKLIHVKGAAGTGKTVLLSSVFADLAKLLVEDSQGSNLRVVVPEDISSFEDARYRNLDVHIVVNHNEQRTVYDQIAKKLQLQSKNGQIVHKPTTFINSHSPSAPVDVVLIDEAHLLLTQGNQGYQGKNQLKDLLERAKIVLAIYDPRQVVSIRQHANAEWQEWMSSATSESIVLTQQHRIAASEEVVHWIERITHDLVLERYPDESGGYDFKVFDSPRDLHLAIQQKARSTEYGLSRLIASYDWEWNSVKVPGGQPKKGFFAARALQEEDLRSKVACLSQEIFWSVSIGDWSLPWNYEIEQTFSRNDRKAMEGKSWAEQEHTINEVGSIYTIQGFDLNVAGVILGKSVTFRDGKIVLDPSASKNTQVTKNRSDSGRDKEEVSRELLQNELNVLLTRGVHGLYIYAEDPELREALKASLKR